jgi:hypothetical protein
LRTDPALGRSMAESGRAHVLKFFDRDKLAKDYLSLLERLLQKQNDPGRRDATTGPVQSTG